MVLKITSWFTYKSYCIYNLMHFGRAGFLHCPNITSLYLNIELGQSDVLGHNYGDI